MIEVTVTRKVTSPSFQVFTSRGILNGHDELTPSAAIAATEIAFGSRGGTVSVSLYDENGWVGDKSYTVYPKSVRRVYLDA